MLHSFPGSECKVICGFQVREEKGRELWGGGVGGEWEG